MRFRLIEAERAQHPVSLLCSVLGVTRAGYYAWRRRRPSRRALADERLARLIAAVFTDSRETYGAPRIQAELADDYGVWRRPQARRPADARARSRGRLAPAQGLQDDDADEGGARCGRSRAAPVPRSRARPALGCRHHLRPDLGGVRLPRLRGRRLEPPGRRLVDARRPRAPSWSSTRSGWRSPGEGRSPGSSITPIAARSTRASPSARRSQRGRRPAEHGPPRRRLRQRGCGELLRDARDRAARPAHVPHPRPGTTGASSRSSRASTTAGRRHSTLGQRSPDASNRS